MCNANGWILSWADVNALFGCTGGNEMERKTATEGRGREGEGDCLFVCVFGYREERREECAFYRFGLLKEQNKKHILYLNLTCMPLCKKFFGMKYKGTRDMEVFLKCKILCSPPFPPNLDGQNIVGLDENCIHPHYLSSSFPPKTKCGNVFAFFPPHFYFPPIPNGTEWCLFTTPVS